MRLMPSVSRTMLGWLSITIMCAGPVSAAPANYEIDPEHLSIGFLVEHIGYAKVLGMFRKASGALVFDEESGELGAVTIEIDTESVFSNHRKRDEHLRGADFLNANEFPTMTFRSSGAKPSSAKRYELRGELTLLGETRPVTLTATWNKSGQYPFSSGILGGKPWVMGVSARGQFKRSDFSMNYSVDNGWVGDVVELIIEFEARKQK